MDRSLVVGVLVALISLQAHSETTEALRTLARLAPTDSQAVQVAKLVHVLNDHGYLHARDPFGPPESQLSPAQRRASLQVLERYGYRAEGPSTGSWSYQLDSLRSPSDMLEQRVGGSCGSMALVTAQALVDAGLSPAKLRIVSAVTTSELRALCEGRKNQPRNDSYRGGAQGHVFLMLQGEDGTWRLVNTTYGPQSEARRAADPRAGNPQAAYLQEPRRGAHWVALESATRARRGASLDGVLAAFDWSDLEAAEVGSPESLEASLRAGRAQELPVFPSLPGHFINSEPGAPAATTPFQPMSVFHVSTLADYPRHKFEERLNLIASGTKSSAKCRWDEFPPTSQTGTAPTGAGHSPP
jgi:hypothetical protein